MFSSSRFISLLRHHLAQAPRWYFFAVPLAIVLVILFGVWIEEGAPAVGKDRFWTPYVIQMILLYANSVALLLIATHFLGSQLKDERAATNTYTLPVSNGERYLGELFVILVVIPALGLLSSLVTVAILKIIGFLGNYPPWGWLDGSFATSLVIYGLYILPWFALSKLLPKRLALWGIALATLMVFLTYYGVDGTNSFQSVGINVADLDELPAGNDLYGPRLDVYDFEGGREWFVNPLALWIEQPTFYFPFFLVLALLLFACAWRGLQYRQA